MYPRVDAVLLVHDDHHGGQNVHTIIADDAVVLLGISLAEDGGTRTDEQRGEVDLLRLDDLLEADRRTTHNEQGEKHPEPDQTLSHGVPPRTPPAWGGACDCKRLHEKTRLVNH